MKNIRKPLTKQQRIDLWEKYNHRCAYCGCELEYKDMQVDHIKSIFLTDYRAKHDLSQAEIAALNSEENLLPACRQCNFYKTSNTLEDFREDLATTLMNNLRKNFQFRLAVKHGLVTDNHLTNVKFYYETMLENKM